MTNFTHFLPEIWQTILIECHFDISQKLRVKMIPMLYIRYVQLLVFKISKRHLTFSKRLGRQLISLKILISNS